ncbi:MAG: sugar ABC transporter substrate-binding protein [Bacillota bacterium]
MKFRWNRFMAALVVVLFVVTVAGCGGAKQPQQTQKPASGSEAPKTEAPKKELPKEIVIGWTPPDVTGVFKTATDFFEAAAKEARAKGINVKIITQSPATHTAFGDQVAILEDFIQRKVNVIAVSPAEIEVIKPALVKANNAGIPVIVVNLLEPIQGVQVASYIGFDNTVAAAVAAYSVLDYFGGPGVLGTGRKVEVKPDEYLDLAFWEKLYSGISAEEKAQIKATGAIIEGVAGGFFSTARLKGFNGVIEKYPGIRIVGTLPADWNREKGIKAAEDFLSANPPGKLDFIWAASNEMGLGAMLAAEAAKRDKEVKVFTNDGTPESVTRIREGRLIAETWHGFPEWGWYGTKFAVMLALGQKVPQFYDIRPRVEYAANADMFYPNPKLEAIDWDKIKNDYLSQK